MRCAFPLALIASAAFAGSTITPAPTPQKRVEAPSGAVQIYNDGGSYGLTTPYLSDIDGGVEVTGDLIVLGGLLVGDGGETNGMDGGTDGIVRASGFISLHKGASSNLYHSGDYVLDHVANSDPALVNYGGALELAGHDIDGAGRSDVYVGALHDRTDGDILTVLNRYCTGMCGTELSVFSVAWNGDTNQNGWITLGSNKSDGRVMSATGALVLKAAGTEVSLWNGVSGPVATFYSGAGPTQVAQVTGAGVAITTGVLPGRHTLNTCASGIEGQIESDVLSGASTGKRTKSCLCTSDGSAVYKWQNIATGTLGTTTTCGTE